MDRSTAAAQAPPSAPRVVRAPGEGPTTDGRAQPDPGPGRRPPLVLTLRLALGGALGGGFLGAFAGASCGTVVGLVRGDLALGLDGAVWGSVLAACAGGVYGVVLGLRPLPPGSATSAPGEFDP